MSSKHQKKISISMMIPFLVFILFFSIMIWKKYKSSQKMSTPSSQHQQGGRLRTLFFINDDLKLTREAREAEPCEDDISCLQSVLEELLNGPIGDLEKIVPDGTVINSVRIDGNQAIIDFNNIFSETMISSSSAEMLAVYSIVNTIVFNYPQIQNVKINIDGNESAMLRHLDLSEPLLPDFSLEQHPVCQ